MENQVNFISQIRQLSEKYNIKELLEKSANSDKNEKEPLFAAVCIACKKGLNQTPFDEQLIAANALTEGKIIEMPTGEGKTLCGVFAAVWHKLKGRKIHILTFNDYLAERDCKWMKPVYDLLDTKVDFITEKSSLEERKKAYQNDVVYISARESCFDYLRDFTAQSVDELSGQAFDAALVDEADSLLIDEARIPMVVAGETEIKYDDELEQVSDYVKTFEPDDYEISLENESIFLTEEGAAKAEQHYGLDNIYDEENTLLLSKINDCLKAWFFLQEDKDYIKREGKILLIDKFTGRTAENRHYPGALQTAVELKHGLKTTTRGVVMGSIALQYFVRRYKFLSAMTGTAEASRDEFYQIYGLELEKISPHVPNLRKDHPLEVYYDTDSKCKGIAKAAADAHQKGQPVLIGTGTIAQSEELYKLLKEHGIEAKVLNAKNDKQEAEIISGAGAPYAVTISTNMAGRGVDIKLGGKEEKEREKAVQSGGLLVISTYMPESSRIVYQLLGRSARQGDPGESRRFVALDEPIMEKYKLNSLLPKNHIPQPTTDCIDDRILIREVERVQRISEGDCFDIRERLMKFTMIGEKHRDQVFEARTRILEGGNSELWDSSKYYQKALEELGRERLEEIERKTALAAINKFWSDYLEYTEELRRGIHLVEVGGKSPSEEYNISAEEYYMGMEQELKDYMEEKLTDLLENGEENYSIDVPKNIHTYLLEDTGDELNKTPLLLNIFDDDEDNDEYNTDKKAEREKSKKEITAESVLDAPQSDENKEKAAKEKKGFLFWKKKK